MIKKNIIKIVKSFEDSGLLLKGVIEKIQNEFNSFPSNVPLIYPLKASENLRISDVFRGYIIGTLVENGLRNKKEDFLLRCSLH